MMHIQVNNGDFFIEESQVIEITDIAMEQDLVMINGELLRLHNFTIYTTYGPSTIIDTLEVLQILRQRLKKEVIHLWQSA